MILFYLFIIFDEALTKMFKTFLRCVCVCVGGCVCDESFFFLIHAAGVLDKENIWRNKKTKKPVR